MEILHKRGKDNLVVDALSRKDEVQTYAISIVIPEWLDEIRREYAKDPNTCALIEDPNRGSKFEWRNDILWYKRRIYLNPTSRFVLGVVLMQEGHPITFESRKLNKRESLKSTYDKEMLDIIHALTKW